MSFTFVPSLPELAEAWPAMPQEVVRWLTDRDRQLEDFLGAGGGSPPTVLWTVPNALSPGKSHSFRLRDARTLANVEFELGSPGTTTTTVELRKNGVAATTVTIPANSTSYSAVVSVAFVASDTFSAAITSPGTNSANFQLQANFT